ncbi:hypothetical protein U1Q18_005593, partial [Sarracenia purpurea var. burkii]
CGPTMRDREGRRQVMIRTIVRQCETAKERACGDLGCGLMVRDREGRRASHDSGYSPVVRDCEGNGML